MTLPGPSVAIVDAAPPAASLTDTGTAFVVGLAERGSPPPAATGQTYNPPRPLEAGDAVHSYGEFVTRYGARQAYNGTEHDVVESFFAEGGSRLYFMRKVGPNAVAASTGLSPAVGAVSLRFVARGAGSWANSRRLTVTSPSGSTFQVQVTDTVDTSLIRLSPVFSSNDDAVAFYANDPDFLVTLGDDPRIPVANVKAFSGGTDDRANITDAQIQEALNRMSRDLGPGQVMLPGDTRTAAHSMLAAHAASKNRWAYGDLPDSASAATVAAAAAAVRALGSSLARRIQLLEPWLTAPAIATGGPPRTIPPCGVQAGMAARSDAAGNPNKAVAGLNGISRFAIAPKYNRSTTERTTLADAGVTVFRLINGQVQAYDDVTPVNPATDPQWVGAAGGRLVMRIVQDALAIAEAHMFGAVSGSVDLAAFAGDLRGMLAGWKLKRALFGDTAADAYRVEAGPSVNTPESLQARQLKAALALKISPNAREVIVQVTNTPLTATL